MKLSVIMIVHNQAANLNINLSVIPEETKTLFERDEIELIVVDAYSNIIEMNIQHNLVDLFRDQVGKNVSYYFCPTKSMPGASRNRGMEMARGEYLWFLDGDDDVDFSVVPQILKVLQDRTKIPLLMLDYTVAKPDGSRELISFSGKRLKPWECGVMVWHKIIRNELCGRFKENCLNEDIDWWMRCCLNCDIDHYFAPGINAYCYHQNAENSITGTCECFRPHEIVRLIKELRIVKATAKAIERPSAFIDHLSFLMDYWEGKALYFNSHTSRREGSKIDESIVGSPTREGVIR